MAFIQMNVMSEALLRTVNVNVILPIDKIQMPDQEDAPAVRDSNFRTLYLLHGIFGSQVDWINGTKLQRWAEEKNLAVVMPAGENKFYVDRPVIHENFGRFIGDELVNLTRKMFPLSDKKEDTFIGGLSMGGYGALRNGLHYHDTFGRVIALSAPNVVDTDELVLPFMTREYLETFFGNIDEARKSNVSVNHLIEDNALKGCNDQKIYLACGSEDFLLQHTIDLKERFDRYGYDTAMEIGPGGHEWDFWNTYIKHVIDWLPLDDESSGLTSGNVGR